MIVSGFFEVGRRVVSSSLNSLSIGDGGVALCLVVLLFPLFSILPTLTGELDVREGLTAMSCWCVPGWSDTVRSLPSIMLLRRDRGGPTGNARLGMRARTQPAQTLTPQSEGKGGGLERPVGYLYTARSTLL